MSEALQIAAIVAGLVAGAFMVSLTLAAIAGAQYAELREYRNTFVGPWARAFDIGFKLGNPDAAERRRYARIERNRARLNRKNQEN